MTAGAIFAIGFMLGAFYVSIMNYLNQHTGAGDTTGDGEQHHDNSNVQHDNSQIHIPGSIAASSDAQIQQTSTNSDSHSTSSDHEVEDVAPVPSSSDSFSHALQATRSANAESERRVRLLRARQFYIRRRDQQGAPLTEQEYWNLGDASELELEADCLNDARLFAPSRLGGIPAMLDNSYIEAFINIYDVPPSVILANQENQPLIAVTNKIGNWKMHTLEPPSENEKRSASQLQRSLWRTGSSLRANIFADPIFIFSARLPADGGFNPDAASSTQPARSRDRNPPPPPPREQVETGGRNGRRPQGNERDGTPRPPRPRSPPTIPPPAPTSPRQYSR
jgi:hypothetical protein